MRPLHIYLAVYFLLIFGAAIAVWRSGALAHMSPLYLVLAAAVAVGLGVILAATAAPVATRE